MSSEREHRTDWEHLVFLAIVLIFLVWYLWTSTVASPTFSNLILIAPVGAFALILTAYIGLVEIIGVRATPSIPQNDQVEARAETTPSRFRAGSLRTITLLMGLFGLFVAAMPYLGFDVASFLFIIATLWLLGERRVIFSLLLALGISAGISIAALALLTFPIPMGIARSLWSAL